MALLQHPRLLLACVGLLLLRKSVTHAVDLPSPQRPVAQTKKAEDDSMLPTGARKTITPQDTSKAAPSQSASEQEASVSQDPCAAAPVVGPCKGTFPRWYYDQNVGECKHFLYGGCQGNHNNFLQELDCVMVCHGSLRMLLQKPVDTAKKLRPQNR
uniref:BPTI/Kunitz inhibitor domain-containing protein n=1 Tax=Maylandia zebra TaxID=106582 RepID=A0A3P9C5H8_9CICH